jgi:hypothetical protein
MKSATRLIDTYARTFDVTDTRVVLVDAEYVKVIWDVRVQPGPESGPTLSMTTRFVTTDHSSRERLRAAWSVLGPVSAALSKRALAALKRYAEDQDRAQAAEAGRPASACSARASSGFAPRSARIVRASSMNRIDSPARSASSSSSPRASSTFASS